MPYPKHHPLVKSDMELRRTIIRLEAYLEQLTEPELKDTVHEVLHLVRRAKKQIPEEYRDESKE